MSQQKVSNLRNRIFRGGLLLTVGKGVTQGCSFLRNVVVARIVGVENFGIAATFSITVLIFEMLGTISVDRLLVQAKDGDDERFQSTAHAVLVLRGFGSGILIAACAWPMAHLFGIPQATWAFRYLALLPIMRGFTHLDSQRIQRELTYGPSVALDIAQQAIPTLLAWPIAVWTKDYSAMLWLLLLQGFIGTAGSYVVAHRPYRWFWDASYVERFLRFGWPLIANALFLFGIYQGDRFLIGTAGRTLGSHVYSMRDLGIYSVGTSLTLTPMIAFSTICSALMLPLFSSLQSRPTELAKRYEQSIQLVGLVSGFFALPLILSGGWIVTAIYGHAYSAAGAFIGWMAAAQAVRMARFTPAMGAMALGDTTNAMYSNMIRFSSLLLTVYVIVYGKSLTWIAMSGFFGEVLSLAVCVWKLDRDHKISAWVAVKSTLALLAAMGISAALAGFIGFAHPAVRFALVPIVLAVFLGLKKLAFPELLSIASLRSLYFTASSSRKKLTDSKDVVVAD
jgi:O-antigen/teichoic acid export membrane protein